MPRQKVDVIADITIQSARRDQSGLIGNSNKAIVDVTMVLSDVADNELLGSAEFQGKSPDIYTGGAIPEVQAIDALSSRLADVLVTSGCGSERITNPTLAEKPTPPPQETPNVSNEPDVQRAETLNDEGKNHFRSGDLLSAERSFIKAINLQKHPKFIFNLCLAQDGLHLYPKALASCRQALNLAQETRLREKITLRIELIQQHIQDS